MVYHADVVPAFWLGLFSICNTALSFSAGAFAAEDEKVKIIHFGELMQVNRRIVEHGWFLDIYDHSSKYFIRQGTKECEVPDAAYLASAAHIPREIELLPMAGAHTVIIRSEQLAGKQRIWWSESAAWHGDYASVQRSGSYVVDQENRILWAASNGKVVSYLYNIPPEPSHAASCFRVGLPSPGGS